MVTIVVSGPQATGKTTLAMALGRELAAPVFSRDPLMEALSASRLPWPRPPRNWLPETGLRLQTALLLRQLELGQSAVLECVAPRAARQGWREATRAGGHQFLSVECVCSDVDLHRSRFQARQDEVRDGRCGEDRTELGGSSSRSRGRRGFGWDYVLATMRAYRPDEDADFVADSVRPVTDLVAHVLTLVRPGP